MPLLAALSFAGEVVLVADRSTSAAVRSASRLGAVVAGGPEAGSRAQVGRARCRSREWGLEPEVGEVPATVLVANVQAVVVVPDAADFHRVRIEAHLGGRPA